MKAVQKPLHCPLRTTYPPTDTAWVRACRRAAQKSARSDRVVIRCDKWGEECAAGRGGPRGGRRAWRTGAWGEGEEGAVGPATWGGSYRGAVIGVCVGRVRGGYEH